MSQSCVMSLVSSNLMRSTLCLSKTNKPWFIGTAKSVLSSSKPVRGLKSLKYSCTKFDFFNQTGPPEIQFPGGSTSEEELPSRPSKGPVLVPLEVPELPHIPEITPPEVTTVPSDPPPQTPGPEFPAPPSPSPPMPDTPNPPSPESPPDVIPPNWEPPRSPEIPPPGIDKPPPMGPTII